MTGATQLQQAVEEYGGTDHDFVLLGKSIPELAESMGAPFAYYSYKGRDVFMFESNRETITCEATGGVVVRVNSLEDRRSATRIVPGRNKQAILRHGNCRHNAEVIDLSAKSVSMRLEGGCLPQEGEFVTFCTSLRMHAMEREFISLAGTAHRVAEETTTVAVVLHTPFETHSYRALINYLTMRQALNSLGKSLTYSPSPEMDRCLNDEVTIVKSDLCMLCEEGACGFSHSSYAGKELPEHRGIHERI